MVSGSYGAVMDSLVEALFRLGSKLLDRHAIEPVIALLCLHFTAVFVQMAGSLDGSHVLLYWLCVLVAVVTAAVGLAGVGAYAVRRLSERRLPRTGSPTTPD